VGNDGLIVQVIEHLTKEGEMAVPAYHHPSKQSKAVIVLTD
jgi:hypothetical protein